MTAGAGGTQREFELKLVVPSRSRAALRKAVAADPAWSRPVTMQARYFDTADRLLARAGMALRVRREGRVWVQVLKVSRPGELARDEYSVRRPNGTLDPEALRATPAHAVLQALPAAESALEMRYETRVARRTRALRTRGGTVELALDEGWISGGDQRARIGELEVELVRGSPAAVFAQARRWQAKFGLVLDARTKAERGDLLARAAPLNEPRRASNVRLDPAMSPGSALRAMAIECAAQIQSNAADLALGVGGDEHVHQLRVGIRRLRSVWRFFEGWADAPPPALVERTRAVFAGMGAARDAAVIESVVEPELRAAGMPTFSQPPPPPHDAQAHAAGPEVQPWLLDLLEWIESIDVSPRFRAPAPAAASAVATPTAVDPAVAAGAAPGEPLTIEDLAHRRLRRWHANLCAASRAFEALPDAERHLLRKRAKRLRYAMEFCRDALERRRSKRCLQRLGDLLEVLGQLSDLTAARDRYETLSRTEPAAWFARGWIAARVEAVVPVAIAEFDLLAKAGPVRD